MIAEMSANHAGKLENALEIVRGAKRAGADCLKIQTYTADTLTLNCDNEYFRVKDGLWDGYKLYDLYKDAYTPWEWQPIIKEECDKLGLDFLSTPFDRTAVDFLEEMDCKAYKIASFELVDIPLIEYTASKGKPMIISCGMGSIGEIEDAVAACRRMGNEQIVLLKCCSEYPANWDDMHLANIPDMYKRFGVPIGLSDHSMGSLAAVAVDDAVDIDLPGLLPLGIADLPAIAGAENACVVEKHVCISRKIKNPDSEFSMEMEEFAQMVKDVRAAKRIAQGPNYSLTKKEKASMAFRRSLFAVKDIQKGEPFTQENVRSVRPSAGLSPKYYDKLLTRKASRCLKAGTPILEKDYE